MGEYLLDNKRQNGPCDDPSGNQQLEFCNQQQPTEVRLYLGRFLKVTLSGTTLNEISLKNYLASSVFKLSCYINKAYRCWVMKF